MCHCFSHEITLLWSFSLIFLFGDLCLHSNIHEPLYSCHFKRKKLATERCAVYNEISAGLDQFLEQGICNYITLLESCVCWYSFSLHKQIKLHFWSAKECNIMSTFYLESKHEPQLKIVTLPQERRRIGWGGRVEGMTYVMTCPHTTHRVH